MKKIVIVCAVILPVVLFIAYSALWFYGAEKIKSHAFDPSIRVENLAVAGFPGPYRITGTVTASIDGIIWNANPAEIKGFPLPDFPVRIVLPQGAKALEPADGDLLSLEFLEIEGPFPRSLPASSTPESLKAWRDAGGQITADHFRFVKGPLSGEGAGYIKLDESLQPAGVVNTRVRGHGAYLAYLKDKGLVKERQAMLAETVLGGLSRPDEESGEAVMDVGLTLQNQRLFLGPLPVAQVPEIRWDSGNHPARPE